MVSRQTTMKVAYVGFVLGHGGDALQILTLAEGMVARGASVEIVVPVNDDNDVFVARCTASGIPASQSELLSITGSHTRQRLRSLIRLLRSIDADVIHVHAGHSSLPMMMMLALCFVRPRSVVATIHSPYRFFESDSLRARVWAFTAKRTLRAVVSPSDHGSDFQRTCGVPADLVVTVRNAIDLSEFAGGDPSEPHGVLAVGKESPIVLFTSRLELQKRPIDAVRIFAEACIDQPGPVLVFVGTGALESSIRQEASRLGVADRVQLVGYQTNVADWLATATVWIFPTESENFSVALLEAMAAGCPILATDCPGNDEILENGINSVTYEVGDVATAADLLGDLLNNSTLRSRLRVGAKSTASKVSVEEMTEQYIQVYGRTCGNE